MENEIKQTSYQQGGVEFTVSHEKPFIYDKCREQFNIDWESVVITYGNVVYSKNELSPDLLVHEGVHVVQQKEMGVEIWWEKYFNDKEFRLSQEVEAYKAQIKFIKMNVKDRNYAFRACHRIWQDMVRMYGNMCDYATAKKLTS